MYFLAEIRRNFGLTNFDSLVHIRAYFGVLFTVLNIGVVYQNRQISGMSHLSLPPPAGDIRDSKGNLKDLDDVDLAIAAGWGQILLCEFCSQVRGPGYPPNL